MAYRHLTIVREGPGEVVERVTLNRPEVRNALNDALIADLSEWAASIHDQREQNRPRAALLAGAGPSFSAGADLAWMAKTVDYTHEQNLQDAAELSRLFERLDTLPVPLIGRIHGVALGGGAGLAAVCDVAIAEDETIFGFTEVRLGIVPAVISPFVLAKIGRSAARDLFLTGTRFPAARAREIGLVHRVVPSAGLDEAVADCVQEVLAGGPQAVAIAKTLIRQIATSPPDEAATLTAQTIAARRVSAEGQEGLRAFLGKRKPGWIG